MNKNPLNNGMIEVKSNGTGELSWDMLAERTEELVSIAVHPVTWEDGEKAHRELTGGDGMDAQQASPESISDDERWNLIAGSTGEKAEESASEDEDEKWSRR